MRKQHTIFLGQTTRIECAKTILRWIERERLESFTGKAALDKVKGKWPKVSLINPGLEVLEERGYVLPRVQSAQGKGRPSRVYAVNPLLFLAKI